MSEKKDYCVLIISYGRPDKCLTAQYLEEIKFERPWFVVCSTDDSQLEGYKRRFGDRVVVFNKDDIDFDTMDNFGIKKVGVYARAACFNVARQLGYKYFASFDDDYTGFNWRYVTKDLKKLATRRCQHIAEMFDAMFSFVDSSPHLLEASFCVNGNYIGGAKSPNVWLDVLPRAVNTFFNNTEKKHLLSRNIRGRHEHVRGKLRSRQVMLAHSVSWSVDPRNGQKREHKSRYGRKKARAWCIRKPVLRRNAQPICSFYIYQRWRVLFRVL